MRDSWSFIAPECQSGNDFSFASDVFSLGALFNEIDYQQVPYEDESVEAAKKYISTNRRPAGRLELNDPIYSLIFGCWLQDATQRPLLKDVIDYLKLSIELEQTSKEDAMFDELNVKHYLMKLSIKGEIPRVLNVEAIRAAACIEKNSITSSDEAREANVKLFILHESGVSKLHSNDELKRVIERLSENDLAHMIAEYCYSTGYGNNGTKNFPKAYKAARLASPDCRDGLHVFLCKYTYESNSPLLYYLLGRSYGDGSKRKELKRSFNLLSRAVTLAADASTVNPLAQYHLSVCYREGLGTEKNSEKANELLNEAAKSGIPSITFVLGQYLKKATMEIRLTLQEQSTCTRKELNWDMRSQCFHLGFAMKKVLVLVRTC